MALGLRSRAARGTTTTGGTGTTPTTTTGGTGTATTATTAGTLNTTAGSSATLDPAMLAFLEQLGQLQQLPPAPPPPAIPVLAFTATLDGTLTGASVQSFFTRELQLNPKRSITPVYMI